VAAGGLAHGQYGADAYLEGPVPDARQDVPAAEFGLGNAVVLDHVPTAVGRVLDSLHTRIWVDARKTMTTPGARDFVRSHSTPCMVDFQSRDTTRGLSDDEDDEDENEDAERAAEADDETDAEPDGDADTDAHGSGTDDSPAETHSTVDAASTDDPLSATTPSGEQGETTHDGHAHGEGDGHSHHRGHDAHDHGPDVGQLGVAVMTVSSSRTRDDDPSGDAIVEYVGDTDHEVVTRDLVVDDLDGVQRSVLALTGRDDVDAVVTTGGTGVTPDDVTVEAIEPLFDKHLPGFGELFRVLSFEEVGTRAMSSRTTAGISEGVPVFCLPGSENAVRLGMEELVLAELEHLVGLATRE